MSETYPLLLDELPADCSQTETLAFEALCEADAPLRTSAISKHTHVTDSATRQALSKLRERGLVMRGRSPVDARIWVYWADAGGSQQMPHNLA